METPVAIVRASVRMLPRLEAEESMQAATRIGVAVGGSPEARTIAASWAHTAATVTRAARRHAPPLPTEAMPRMGIGLRTFKSKKRVTADG